MSPCEIRREHGERGYERSKVKHRSKVTSERMRKRARTVLVRQVAAGWRPCFAVDLSGAVADLRIRLEVSKVADIGLAIRDILACEHRFGPDIRPRSSCRGQQAALKCSGRSARV